MKNKLEMSPMDSWILINPNDELDIVNHLQEKWFERTRYFRKYRGDILASSLEIEIIIEVIIAEVFFPNFDEIPSETDKNKLYAYANVVKVRDLFINVFLRQRNITFGRKKTLFDDLSKNSQALGNLISNTLKADLVKVVQIRNTFAHNPITFEVNKNEKLINLQAFIMYSGEIVELTDIICSEYKTLISTTLNSLKEVLDKLKKDKNRIDESGVKIKGSPIFIGHLKLDDDSWQETTSNSTINADDFIIYTERPTDLTLSLTPNDDES